MTDSEKTMIKALTETSDYSLWKVRVEAACEEKDCEDALDKSLEADESDTMKKARRKASAIIIKALSDTPLRIVKEVKGSPVKMLEKLDARYASKTAASKITKMTDLITMKYKSLKSDITKHIDLMAAAVEQLKGMDVTIQESFAVAILVASVEVPALRPATTAIKTLAENDLKWETVAERLIEEAKGLKEALYGESSRAAVTNSVCGICRKTGHETDRCWLNPLNPDNKLGLTADKREMAERQASAAGKSDKNGRKKSRKKAKKDKRAAMAKTKQPGEDVMLVDSGTTSHITARSETVSSRSGCDISIALGDDSKVKATEKGDRRVQWAGEDGPRTIRLSETLIADDIAISLLSVPALVNKGIGVIFLPGKAMFVDLQDNMKVLATASQAEDGLFYISDQQDSVPAVPKTNQPVLRAMMAIAKEHASSPHDTETQSVSELAENTETSDSRDQSETKQPCKKSDYATTWHLRLGHAMPVRAVIRHLKSGALPPPKCQQTDCRVCARGKYRKRFDGSLTTESRPGRLHADTKGQVDELSTQGHKYFLTVVDEYTRFTYTCPLRSKGEASEALLHYVKCFEKQTGHTVHALHTDGGGEFSKARKALKSQGVKTTHTTSYTAASNGLAERTHGTILALARSCLLQSKLPLKYWGYAVRHVTMCKNVVTHSTTGRIPYDELYGTRSPDLEHLRPFGCRVQYHPVKPTLKTFKPRLEEGINLGLDDGGIYWVLTETGVARTKHVRMLETEFPGTAPTLEDKEQEAFERDFVADEVQNDPSSVTDSDTSSESSQSGGEEPPDIDELVTYKPAQPSTYGETDEEEETDTDHHESDGDADDDSAGDSSPSDEDFVETQDGNGDNDDDEGGEQAPTTTSRRSGLRPVRDVNYVYRAVPAHLIDDMPKLGDALKSPEKGLWLKAIEEEFKTLTDSETYEPCDGPQPGDLVLPTGIVLKLKRDKYGDPVRRRGRLVARGCYQSDGESYVELYTPVACIELVRLLLAVAVEMDWDIEHVDIKGAFLYAKLPDSDKIVIRLPNIDGVKAANGQYVRLQRSLYGLRQALKLWYAHLARALRKIGLIEATSTSCLFKSTGKAPVFVLVYVDDLLIMGAPAGVARVKTELAKQFTTTELGPCTHFLGIAVDRSAKGLFLSQQPFTDRLVEFAGLKTSKPAPTPLPLSHCLYEKTEEPTDDEVDEMRNVPFRSVLGSLLYLATRSRPDISTAVSMLAKFQDKPTPRLWKTMKHVVRYLKGTSDYGLLLPKTGGDVRLEVWSDADWARDISTRRSRTGGLLVINSSPVSWTSRLQVAVALSTAEAEFIALAETVRNAAWVREVLSELGHRQTKPTNVYQDNLGTISWTEEVQGLRNVKHVGIKYHYVREMVVNKAVEVIYTPSEKNCSDSFTKVLIGTTFQIHRGHLGVCKVIRPDSEGAC